jgi:hypothetical protein
VSGVCRAWLAGILLAGVRAPAQDAFAARWKALAGQQPEGVKLVIKAPKAEFFLGEVIPLDVEATSTRPWTFRVYGWGQDRTGFMTGVSEFAADPAAFAQDPLQGLPIAVGSGGGRGLGGPAVLTEKPLKAELMLNEWVRFRKPGDYRVYAISTRVSQVEGMGPDNYLQMQTPGKPVELVSNVLTLKIRAGPAAWVKAQIAAARKILDSQAPPTGQTPDERLRAIRVLSSLDSLEAAEELARRLTARQDAEAYQAGIWVVASPYRKQLLPLMERRLAAADQAVSGLYLDILARLSAVVALGGPGPPYSEDAAGRDAWLTASKQFAEVQKRKQDEYAERLFASLPGKQPEARAASLLTLFNSVRRNGPEPPWMPSVVATLAADFRNLDGMTQTSLLEYDRDALNGPALLPALRDLIAHPPPGPTTPSIQSVALRRLYELSPDEGRKIIVDEIRQPTKRLPFATLAMLPDATLPELNEVLAQRFDAKLILRYATGEIVKRVESRYLAQNAEMKRHNLPQACAAPLAFYFLKYDQPFGERALREDFARAGAYPACYDIGFQFQDLGRWAYSPALERLAIESLTSPNVAVKRGAAEVLGKYGTTAAEKPLWDTMEYFHSWWKGREDGLKEQSGDGSAQFERVLRTALARADAWVLEEPELNRLLALCTTGDCRGEVAGWISAAKAPLTITIFPQSGGFGYRVGQYGPDGEDWLRRKLAQYPAGTAFRVARYDAGTPEMKAAQERAEAAVRTSGQKLAQ